eukprot:6224683-Pyramimonas_sp.AAC.1
MPLLGKAPSGGLVCLHAVCGVLAEGGERHRRLKDAHAMDAELYVLSDGRVHVLLVFVIRPGQHHVEAVQDAKLLLGHVPIAALRLEKFPIALREQLLGRQLLTRI